ncbi:hypothetical protein [Oligoflexus tunisiensis]|uniref:hypothetical protein n=1 Tax=Oligoflexus tunisiensis TaxID=708132 RepID=UPI00114C9B78|nr:hypothetical protein [Oligoflexus tunisiensis]
MCGRVSILCVMTLLLSACQPIVVRVGKRTQGTGAEPNHPIEAATITTEQLQTWNTVEDFLQHLDDIKTLGRDALLKRYHEDGRQQIRAVFRRFRDAVAAAAQRDGTPTSPYLSDLKAGTCVPISTQDIFGLEAFGDLRVLLETVFLSRIQPTEALPEPEIPGDMDAITKLGFFELGIEMDGQSFYEEADLKERQGSDLRWKVIHEQSEPEDWFHLDQRGVQFHFLRTRDNPGDTRFSLDARVGEQVYEEDVNTTLPGLLLDYQKILESTGTSLQTLQMQTGWRDPDGRWRKLQISRQLIISQDIAQGHILHMTATEHWQKPEAIQKKFRLDLEAKRLCSGVGGL